MSNKTFLNFILLGGSVEQKIAATAAAGFDEAEIWREDVERCAFDAAEIGSLARQSGLGFADIMVLRDFAGAPMHLHDEKKALALYMLDTAQALGTQTVQSPAITLTDCIPEKVDEDLKWLAQEAACRGLRICYEPMAWSMVDQTMPAAWERLERIGEPNIGLVLDVFHACVLKRNPCDLDGIPLDRIYQLQLSDLVESVSLDNKEHLIDTARHRRVLPGHGHLQIRPFIERLKAGGYTGAVGVEVFSDELKAQPPAQVARQAMAALKAVWTDI